MQRAAVFLDKDGTLFEDPSDSALDRARGPFASNALAGLRLLASSELPLFVLTNEPDLASGRITRRDFVHVQQVIQERLLAEGSVALAGWYTCPHGPTAGCLCRKPASGLLRQAALAHGLDLSRSWIIGDTLDDVESGRRVGCKTVLIDVGHETVWRKSPLREPHHRCPDLLAAAELIVAQREPPM